MSADAAPLTDLASQVSRESHDGRYLVEGERDRIIGDGSVPRTDDWRAAVEWADVVSLDDSRVGPAVETGELARGLRERGGAVVGGTPTTGSTTS